MTHTMSIFHITPQVDKRLDMLRSDFLWQHNQEKKGVHLVNWKTLTLRKQQRGIGIQILRKQNQSSLMKWLWRYSNQDQSLWRRVIKEKYGKEY